MIAGGLTVVTRVPKIPIRRTSKEKPRRPPITLTAEALVASAALLVSLLSLSSSAWFAVRGSVVTAVPPQSVFFYRDAGKGAVLTAGVDTALVNSASANYGDVVTRITMEIDTPGAVDPVFDYETLVTPVFSETAERQAADCPVTARCVRNGRFLAIEEPRRTLDVPGGTSRSEYIGFVLEKGNCAIKGACDAFLDLASAANALDRAQTLTIRFRYQLHSDGEKVATCVLDLTSPGPGPQRKWLAARLQDQGYAFLKCAR